ncbi:2-polyprenyl-6-methoxyphenol hydroxylase [Streptomyces sp. 2131.1]|uniref:FAD-dependent monooxygenase n=1 Tax=Streptomyces sp. 2131.1 TaxID=1855346 RepID=UPI000897C4CA|nr:FAD-dependent monooxygenase [Streptomyces sp. 2131.1]SEB61301.1 2-polyprenyl-6-methoxyphenol hydroxylase [Streptomyces sp. 2131.1]
MDADVIIVGAGPTGLMLANELRTAGVRPLILERQQQLRETPRANGLGGQILDLLRYRGVLGDLQAVSTDPHPAPRFPFGNVHLDFTRLTDAPMHAVQIPQPRLERLLEARAAELGSRVRRGHEVVGISQDREKVSAEVRCADGTYRVRAPYLVACDGSRSRVRDMAGIRFPGNICPEVNRLSQVALATGASQHENGDLDVPAFGRLRTGFTRTDHGVFGFGWLTPEVMLISTTENEDTTYADDTPMTLADLQDSIRRVLGAELPLGEPLRLSRYQFQDRQADSYRQGRVLLAGDAAHQFPATGVALNAGMLDAVNLAWKLAAEVQGWAPPGLLDTYDGERRAAAARTLLHTRAQAALRRGHDPAAEALRQVFQELLSNEASLRRIGAMVAGSDIRTPQPDDTEHALTGAFAPDLALHTGRGSTSIAELMRPARPLFIDLAGRDDLCDTADAWGHRIDIHRAETADRPADALLIRPDAHIAWAAPVGESSDTLLPALHRALRAWFGSARSHPLPLDQPSTETQSTTPAR